MLFVNKIIMKKIYILPLLFLSMICSSWYAYTGSMAKKSNYKVIRVNGKIKFVKTQEEMKRGDSYITGTPIDFLTKGAMAAVINGNSRMILKGSEKGRVRILPATSNTTSRAGALINKIDLMAHFQGRYLIFDEEKLKIGKEAYPMNDNFFFFLRYEHNKELIDKKLGHSNNYLIINKDDLFKIDGKNIGVEEKEMTLYYYDLKNKRSEKISAFTPVFPDLEVLELEVNDLLGLYKARTDNFKIEEITSYLNEFYGRPQKDNLSTWLFNTFKLKKNEILNLK